MTELDYDEVIIMTAEGVQRCGRIRLADIPPGAHVMDYEKQE